MSLGPPVPGQARSGGPGAAVALLSLLLLLLLLLLAALWILQASGWDPGAGAGPASGPAAAHGGVGDVARRRRYAIKPLGHKWDHVNVTYRIVRFPSTLNRGDTERAIAAAFRMWSDVSPLRFRRLPPAQPADITIGFYTFNHTDCWSSPLHRCFDGLNGELAHALLPPRGEIHFDNHEFWILGRSHFSWKQGRGLDERPSPGGCSRDWPCPGPVAFPRRPCPHAPKCHLQPDEAHQPGRRPGCAATVRPAPSSRGPGGQKVASPRRCLQGLALALSNPLCNPAGCVDEMQQCEAWARLRFCARRTAFMKKHCPKICNSCFEAPAAAPTPPARPPHARYLSKGRVITFHCGLNSRPHLHVRWYKDGELLSRSVPGLELLPRQGLRILATELSEGRYTCLVHRTGKILRANSWHIKLKASTPSPTRPHGDVQGSAQAQSTEQ